MENWKDIHEALVRLAKTRAEQDYEIGRALLAAQRAFVHERLGYASIHEYGERLFGFSRRMVGERLRVALSMERLPALDDALRDSQLCWSAAREVTRIATPETASAWVQAAQARTVRELETMVAERAVGDGPNDPPRPDPDRKHVLRFEVEGSTKALLDDAKAKLIRDAGGHLSDDEVLTLLARAVLGGPKDEGRASYQIEISECPSCARIHQGDVEVDPVIAEMAGCDAQVIEPTHVGTPGRATQTIPPRVRRQVASRSRGRCEVPGCGNRAFTDVHHLDLRSEGGTHDPERLVNVCTAHHHRAHAGTLVIEGRASTGFSVRHVDGTSYGDLPEPARVDAFHEAFLALRGSGYPESVARKAIDAARAHVGHAPTTEAVLRRAFASLAPKMREPRAVYTPHPAIGARPARPRGRAISAESQLP